MADWGSQRHVGAQPALSLFVGWGQQCLIIHSDLVVCSGLRREAEECRLWKVSGQRRRPGSEAPGLCGQDVVHVLPYC